MSLFLCHLLDCSAWLRRENLIVKGQTMLTCFVPELGFLKLLYAVTFFLDLSISVRWCLCNYGRLWSPRVMGCCAQRTFCPFSFGLREKCLLLLCAWTVLRLLFCLIAPCLFSWAFSLGNKSYSGSIQSLTSIGSKETPKAPPNPDLPPKMCRKLRLDAASSNGYQRPGSV